MASYFDPDTTNCSKCQGELRRSHRSFFERFFCASAWQCSNCKTRIRHLNPGFQKIACCPRCGRQTLTRLYKPDKIDRMYRGLRSTISRLLGAPLYHCAFCRLQFYDLRRRGR